MSRHISCTPLYCPLAPHRLLIGLFSQDLLPHSPSPSLSKEIKLTTNIIKDAIENHPEFPHMKESHCFMAQINMMGLNIAPICTVTAQR